MDKIHKKGRGSRRRSGSNIILLNGRKSLHRRPIAVRARTRNPLNQATLGNASTPSLSDSSGGNNHAGTAVPRQFETELIPGLPDCLGLECLLRLPFHTILKVRAVCKRWKRELDSRSFYRIRRASGLAHRVISLILRGKFPHTVGKLHIALFEPDTGVCMMRQLAPSLPNININMVNTDATIIGRELVVFGGWDVLGKRRTGEVNIYDLHSRAWRPGAPNPDPERPFSWFVLKEDKVLVVGGRDPEGKKLQSALAYNVATDTWIEMPVFEQEMCYDGNFCDKFWRSREEYDSAILSCRKWLLKDDDGDLKLYRTGKEINMCVIENEKSDPSEEKSEKRRVTEFTLNEDALWTLRRWLGIMPDEVGLYLESYFSGRL